MLHPFFCLHMFIYVFVFLFFHSLALSISVPGYEEFNEPYDLAQQMGSFEVLAEQTEAGGKATKKTNKLVSHQKYRPH